VNQPCCSNLITLKISNYGEANLLFKSHEVEDFRWRGYKCSVWRHDDIGQILDVVVPISLTDTPIRRKGKAPITSIQPISASSQTQETEEDPLMLQQRITF